MWIRSVQENRNAWGDEEAEIHVDCRPGDFEHLQTALGSGKDYTLVSTHWLRSHGRIDVGEVFRGLENEFAGRVLDDRLLAEINDRLVRREGLLGLKAIRSPVDPYRVLIVPVDRPGSFACRITPADSIEPTNEETDDMTIDPKVLTKQTEEKGLPIVDNAKDEALRGMKQAAAQQVLERARGRLSCRLEEAGHHVAAGAVREPIGEAVIAAVLSTVLDYAPFEGRRRQLARDLASEMRVLAYSSAGTRLLDELGALLDEAMPSTGDPQ